MHECKVFNFCNFLGCYTLKVDQGSLTRPPLVAGAALCVPPATTSSSSSLAARDWTASLAVASADGRGVLSARPAEEVFGGGPEAGDWGWRRASLIKTSARGWALGGMVAGELPWGRFPLERSLVGNLEVAARSLSIKTAQPDECQY